MTTIKRVNTNTVIFIIGMFAMFCLLAYNWKHTSDLLSKHIQPGEYGYICALGIELSVVWLSWKLGRTHNIKSMSGFALIMVVIVSAAANLSEGFNIRYQNEFTSVTFEMVDPVQLFISVLATLLISIIVFALSDVLSVDSKEALVSLPETNRVVSKEQTSTVDPVAENKNGKADILLEFITKNPQATYRDIVANTPITNIANIKPLAEQIGYTKTANGWTHTNGATK